MNVVTVLALIVLVCSWAAADLVVKIRSAAVTVDRGLATVNRKDRS